MASKSQLMAPIVLYVTPAQLLQLGFPSSSWNLPGVHAEQAAVPEANVPAGQMASHVSAIFAVFFQDPFSHVEIWLVVPETHVTAAPLALFATSTQALHV